MDVHAMEGTSFPRTWKAPAEQPWEMGGFAPESPGESARGEERTPEAGGPVQHQNEANIYNF